MASSAEVQVANPFASAHQLLSTLQAHFSQLNDRDEAMSRSLNSDYLDQLLIKADTSGLDGDLVRLAAEERPVPEEQQALLVFKRGCGLPCGSCTPHSPFWQLIVLLVIINY